MAAIICAIVEMQKVADHTFFAGFVLHSFYDAGVNVNSGVVGGKQVLENDLHHQGVERHL
jgi:flavin reductase (DIM6/NTAB) family NADH-FMN oxidoreductase RutF